MRAKNEQDYIRIKIGDTNCVLLRLADKVNHLSKELKMEPDEVIQYAIDTIFKIGAEKDGK